MIQTWTKDGVTEHTEAEIKLLYPNVSLRTPTDVGYSLVFVTPQPTCTNLETVVRNGIGIDANGNHVQAWSIVKKFATVAEETAYLAQLATDAQATAVKHFEQYTTDYIQGKIAAYNTANGLAFADIDAFTKYAVLPTSAHNVIAIRFITYADNIWKALRAYQTTLTVIPTDVQVKAILDAVVF